MYVLEIFITGDIVIFALLALLKSPEIGRNSCLRFAGGNYFELNWYTTCNIVIVIWLICNSLPFYAHVRAS